MKRLLTAAAMLLAGSAIAPAANAATYLFTFTGNNYSITDGMFTTSSTLNTDGTYNITSASATITSANSGLPQGAVTLVPGNGENLTNSAGNENYSNLYTPGATSFAFAGIELANNTGFEVNLYNAKNANYGACGATDCLSVPNSGLYNPGDAGTVNISGPVPEPATWAMLLLGFGMIGFAMRKRSNVRTTVSYA